MNHSPDIPIEKRADFDFVRYANCWEDADILCEALLPSQGKRILSICSAGDNAFALAAEGAEVIAADLNPSQIACASLKAAAIQTLEYDRVLEFFGVHDSVLEDRVVTYERLRTLLDTPVRDYWDSRRHILRTGFIHCGKFESYFRLFRTRVLPFVAGAEKIRRVLRPLPPVERVRFYDEEWNTWRWRLLFKVFFSRFVMGRLGRDPEFFRYVEGPVSEKILVRARYALTELPTDENPYLSYILTGTFHPALPRYLRPELFTKVRDGLSRVRFVCASISDAGRTFRGEGFDGFNLSDIFEYLSESIAEELYGELLLVAHPRARFAYWNMLVPRERPKRYVSNVECLREVATQLFAKDKAFFYSRFVVEEAC